MTDDTTGNGRELSYDAPDHPQYDGWAVRGLSLDGKYVAVGWNGTDPTRQVDSFALVEVRTGKAVELGGRVVELPTGQEVTLPADLSIAEIWFHPAGGALVRADEKLIQLDAQMRPVFSIDEPAELDGAKLIGYGC